MAEAAERILGYIEKLLEKHNLTAQSLYLKKEMVYLQRCVEERRGVVAVLVKERKEMEETINTVDVPKWNDRLIRLVEKQASKLRTRSEEEATTISGFYDDVKKLSETLGEISSSGSPVDTEGVVLNYVVTIGKLLSWVESVRLRSEHGNSRFPLLAEMVSAYLETKSEAGKEADVQFERVSEIRESIDSLADGISKGLFSLKEFVSALMSQEKGLEETLSTHRTNKAAAMERLLAMRRRLSALSSGPGSQKPPGRVVFERVTLPESPTGEVRQGSRGATDRLEAQIKELESEVNDLRSKEEVTREVVARLLRIGKKLDGENSELAEAAKKLRETVRRAKQEKRSLSKDLKSLRKRVMLRKLKYKELVEQAEYQNWLMEALVRNLEQEKQREMERRRKLDEFIEAMEQELGDDAVPKKVVSPGIDDAPLPLGVDAKVELAEGRLRLLRARSEGKLLREEKQRLESELREILLKTNEVVQENFEISHKVQEIPKIKEEKKSEYEHKSLVVKSEMGQELKELGAKIEKVDEEIERAENDRDTSQRQKEIRAKHYELLKTFREKNSKAEALLRDQIKAARKKKEVESDVKRLLEQVESEETLHREAEKTILRLLGVFREGGEQRSVKKRSEEIDTASRDEKVAAELR